jgi:Xaa-Pro aminopeptidase
MAYLYHAGKDTVHEGQGGMLTLPGEWILEPHDIINIEFDVGYCGYASQYNQPFSFSNPDKECLDIFNLAAKSYMNALRPRLSVRDLDEAFFAPIRDQDAEC